MFVRYQRVLKLVLLKIKFNNRARQNGAFRNAQTLGQRARDDIANDDLDGNNLDLADKLLAHIQAAHKMRRHADLAQLHHQVFGNAVVKDAFAGDRAPFSVVVRGCIVLEILHKGARFGAFEQNLGLSLKNATAAA